MNTATIARALIEAHRFINAAEKAKAIFEADKYHAGGIESAACRRASMDLTRALRGKEQSDAEV